MTHPAPNLTQRAALHLRVSTARQAEHDVSIPDQKRQGEAWCAARGYQLVETFVELAQRVEVADGEVRIIGSKSRLLQTLTANGSGHAVPTQGLKWRRERDSNPRYELPRIPTFQAGAIDHSATSPF